MCMLQQTQVLKVPNNFPPVCCSDLIQAITQLQMGLDTQIWVVVLIVCA